MEETLSAGTCEEPGTIVQARQLVEDQVGKGQWVGKEEVSRGATLGRKVRRTSYIWHTGPTAALLTHWVTQASPSLSRP